MSEAIEAAAVIRMDALIRSSALWPRWFQGPYDEEIATGVMANLDAAFMQRVEEGTRREVGQRVNVIARDARGCAA